jgi:hypothetical protein
MPPRQTIITMNDHRRVVFDHASRMMHMGHMRVPVNNWWAELLALWQHARRRGCKVRVTQPQGDTPWTTSDT